MAQRDWETNTRAARGTQVRLDGSKESRAEP